MEAWDKFITRQEELIGVDTVNKWLRPLKLVRFDACNLYLEAKDSFQILWFEEHMRKKCQNLLNNNKKRIQVHLDLANKTKYTKKKGERQAPQSFELTFDALDPLATFETFETTENNILTYKLLSKIIHDQSDLASFNPIYIHGLHGTGKTHLLMAVANELKKKGLNAEYVRSETFTEHVVQAIQSGEMSRFRLAYRKLDVLIIDDVHHLSKKAATQEELFHTFNTLHLSGKQIILSSLLAPAQLTQIEPRLISRFEWGIVLPLESHTKKELKKILDLKAKALSVNLPDNVAEFLATTFTSNASKLIQALQALILRTQSNSHPWTPSLANHLLKDLIEQQAKMNLTQEKLLAIVSDHFDLPLDSILGKAQSRECTLPRQIAMTLFREHLEMPFTRIGDIFGRDHSTVMSSCKMILNGVQEGDQLIEPHFREIQKKVKACTNPTKLPAAST